MTGSLHQSALPLRCSVVVTTWKRPVLLRDTLLSLLRQSYPNFEIIIVCDGEDTDVRAISRDFEEVTLVRWVFHPANRGLPAARNTGAREANGEVVLFLDDDVVADPDLLLAHMHHHRQADPRRRLAVTSLAREERQTPLSSYLNESLHENWKETLNSFSVSLGQTGLDSVGEQIERIICFGLNCSIRRDVFLSSGGFNEHFRASDEELEMGLRLYLAGVEFVFEPRVLLTHMNSKDLTQYFRNCWNASGGLDTYRVFELGQYNAQTRHLVSMFHGYRLNRIAARAAWHLSNPLRVASKRLEIEANRTQSHFLFGAWARAAQAGEYWSGAKTAGCNLAKLRSVNGPPRRALMLHTLCNPATSAEASYYTSPRRFRRIIHWLLAAGYTTTTTEKWLKDDLPRKHALLTFDDGYDDLYEELLPLVIKHRLTAVIYLVAERIGASNLWDQKSGLRARNLLTWAQVREMQKYGVEFGSHTLTHPWLPGVSDEQLRREVIDSKHRLEDALGIEIASFAYPSGGVDRRVRSVVAEAGYKLAFTTRPGLNWWNDTLCQRRAEVNDHTSLLDFAFQLRTGYGFRQWISERLKALERDLPTSTLRSLACRLRGAGHDALHRFVRETGGSDKS